MVSLHQGLALGTEGVISLVGAGGKTSLMFRLASELSASGDPVMTTTTTKILRPTSKQTQHLIVSDSPIDVLKKSEDILKRSPHVSAAATILSHQDKLTGFPPEAIDFFWASNLFRWIIVEADGAARRPLKAPASHEPVIPLATNRVIGILGLSVLGKPLNEQHVFRPERISNISGLKRGNPIMAETLCAALVHRQGIFKGTPSSASKIAFLNQADNPELAKTGNDIIERLSGSGNTGLLRVVVGSTRLDPAVLVYRDMGGPSLYNQQDND